MNMFQPQRPKAGYSVSRLVERLRITHGVMTLTSVDRLGRGSVRANGKGVCLLGARGKQRGQTLTKDKLGKKLKRIFCPHRQITTL